jgi:hypothetical protein
MHADFSVPFGAMHTLNHENVDLAPQDEKRMSKLIVCRPTIVIRAGDLRASCAPATPGTAVRLAMRTSQ